MLLHSTLSTFAPAEYPWTLIDCQRELLAAQYLCGLYSALLLMLGDRAQAGNNLERIFVVLMLFAGTCLYAIVVSARASGQAM